MSLLQNIVAAVTSLFRRYPRHDTTAYGPVYKAVVARLTRTGVVVGGTASLPRVEVHSFTEQERLDKEGELRQITFTVESITNTSMDACIALNEGNMELLTGSDLTIGDGTQWRCLGVIPQQLQDLTETSDTNKIIYRLLQSYTLWAERIKTDTDPTPPAEQSEGEAPIETN